jgi:hypothetical protein
MIYFSCFIEPGSKGGIEWTPRRGGQVEAAGAGAGRHYRGDSWGFCLLMGSFYVWRIKAEWIYLPDTKPAL